MDSQKSVDRLVQSVKIKLVEKMDKVIKDHEAWQKDHEAWQKDQEAWLKDQEAWLKAFMQMRPVTKRIDDDEE